MALLISVQLLSVHSNDLSAYSETHLAGSKDYGGELRAVAPLCEEGEGEGLEEDGRDEAVPFALRHGGPCLHIWTPIQKFRALEL